jgi:hypothetical protein
MKRNHRDYSEIAISDKNLARLPEKTYQVPNEASIARQNTIKNFVPKRLLPFPVFPPRCNQLEAVTVPTH